MVASGARKEQIVATASELFRQRGYHATTVRDIARELDLQGGSLYAHIDSKDAVLREIVARAAEAFFAAVEQLAGEPWPAATRLRAMIHAHIGVVTSRLNDATVFLQDWRYLEEPGRAEILRLRDAYEALFRQVLAEGIAAGEFTVRDPRLASIMLLSGLNALPGWFRPDGALSADHIAAEYAEMLLHGLSVRPLADEEDDR